ncbi:MAG: MFS transporter [Oscillospiraceae bacterium]|nr:MFS transporter [Oscillospiraceae bacterium]
MSLLKNRNYLLLRTGWSVSMLGTQFQNFAFSLYVLQKTGSSVAFSATLSMQILPMILFAPVSGYFSDHFNRKRQIILYDFLSAAVVAAFLLLFSAAGTLPVWQINLCVFLLAGLETFQNSAAGCLMQSAVDPQDYTKQKSVDTTVTSLISIFAPALAGLLYGLAGIRAVLLINVASFLFSCLAEFLIRLPQSAQVPEAEGASSFFSSMKSGMRYVRTSKFLAAFLISLSLLNFILQACNVGLTVIAQGRLNLGASAIGILESVASAGYLAGALLCGFLNQKMEKLKMSTIISANVIVTGTAFFLTAVWLRFVYGQLILRTNVIVFAALNLIISLAASILSVNLSSRFQKEIPNEIMGRVGAFSNAILTVCVPLGQVAAGLSLGSLPQETTYAAAGVLCLLLLAFNILHSKKSSTAEPAEAG